MGDLSLRPMAQLFFYGLGFCDFGVVKDGSAKGILFEDKRGFWAEGGVLKVPFYSPCVRV